jgi:hypothetical protein
MNTRDFLSTKEAAGYLETTPAALRKRRRRELAPAWGYRSGRIRYRTTDVICFRLMGPHI